MTTSNIKATFQSDIRKLWKVVTDIENHPAWRSDLSKSER